MSNPKIVFLTYRPSMMLLFHPLLTRECVKEFLTFPAVSPEFEAYSLKELWLLRKRRPEALEELLQRCLPLSRQMAKNHVLRHKYDSFDDVLSLLLHALTKIFEDYDPQRGELTHFVAGSLKNVLHYHLLEASRKYAREIETRGKKVSLEGTPGIEEEAIVPLSPEDVASWVDFESRFQRLAPSTQKLLLIYLSGKSISELSRDSGVPATTLMSQIHTALAELGAKNLSRNRPSSRNRGKAAKEAVPKEENPAPTSF